MRRLKLLAVGYAKRRGRVTVLDLAAYRAERERKQAQAPRKPEPTRPAA